MKEYIDFQDAYSNLSYLLDVFHNHELIHSSLGYHTSVEFEAQYKKESAEQWVIQRRRKAAFKARS